MVKKGHIVTFFLIVALLAGLISQTVMGITQGIKLGLDLQGGFEILYKVTPANEEDTINSETLKATVSALNQRVNVLGVSEPNITIEGEDRVRVQLAGVTDQQSARDLLATEAKLTIRDVHDNVLIDGSELKQNGAKASFDGTTNKPAVTVTLKDARLMEQVTREMLSRPSEENLLVFWLDFEEGVDSYVNEMFNPDPKFLSAAGVREVIATDTAMINGDFTVEETQFLAEVLNAGSLPVKLDELYSNSVGASLGEEAMKKTIYAGFLGIAFIFAYMIIYYRFPGFISVITLSIYIFLVLLIFYWMNAVLTLPGIAALILGVGMAVDANILTAERIKEEIRSGKSVMSAFKVGNRRSFTTIFDANVTTIIAAGVLLMFGSSSIKGFAVMLIVSILVSFLTAVYGSRLLLGLWINSRALNKKPRLFGVKEGEISDL